MAVTLRCANCGSEFTVKPSHVDKRICCSRKCRGEWQAKNALGYDPNQRVRKECVVCGKELWIKKSHVDAEGTYCSRDCMAIHYKTRLKGEANPNFKNAGWHTCPTCNEDFLSYNSNAIYCSVKCRANSPSEIARWNKIRFLRHAAPKVYTQRVLPLKFDTEEKCTCEICGRSFWSKRKVRTCSVECRGALYSKEYGENVVAMCIVCGEPFILSPSQLSQKSTCSRECSRERRRLIQLGELSHLWQGGKTDETKLIRNSLPYKQWREAVFSRDDYVCQMCEQRGGRLTAHHIYQFSRHKEIRFDTGNGITLCWPCHTSIKGKEEEHRDRFLQITGGLTTEEYLT